MKRKVKRLVHFRFDHYKDIESRLEKFAAKGLFLEECGTFLWSFRKDEPKHLKYAVSYFSEGSLFNPDITENQQTYFEYAKAAGWNIVTQFNQMQIFCSDADNPIPFETDEKEKFENIKKCMRKSFLPSIISLVVVFLFNLIVQFNSYYVNPIGFLSDAGRLFSVAIIFAVVFYDSLSLLDYFIWCKRSAHSIANGGACIEKSGKICRIFDAIFLCLIFGWLGWFLLYISSRGYWFSLLIGMAQIPILMIAFWSSIKYLKKKKAAAMVNKVVSFTVLILASFAYLTLILVLIIRFDLHTGDESDYRTVTWELSPTESHDYKLFSNDLPLTCEDLYGPIDYEYYSYEKTVNSTIFLTSSTYRQDSLPAKDSPPRLNYEILESKFKFVYKLAREQLLTIPEWRQNRSFKPINNEFFGTIDAYQEYNDERSTGKYILFFADKIITLDMEEPPTFEQIAIIRETLQL